MANTYTQCYLHLIFAVKNRNALINKNWKDELEMYITGIVQNHRNKMLAIYAMPDHIHFLIGYNVNQLIPDLVEEIKISSNKWVNENKLSRVKFEWQKGYGCFTYSRSQIGIVARYIQKQEEHHKKKLFRDEYLKILKDFNVEFDPKYLFDFFD